MERVPTAINIVDDDTLAASRALSRLRSRTLTLALSALAAPLLFAVMSVQADTTEHRSQTAALFPKGSLGGLEIQRKDFRFGDFKGWLTRDGLWHIEGPVHHRGLLCGTYEVGMRFGIGKPDCTNVEWISEVRYATSRPQCNDAELAHTGTEIDESLMGQFEAISCGERVIRCSGNCK